MMEATLTQKGVSRIRVLVVEDEVELAAYIKRALERAGYAVDVARDGTECLDRAGAEPYDAVVLDGALPGRTGYETCEALRARGCWLPIIMLSESDEEVDQLRALGTGADEALPRHFPGAELLGRLRTLTLRRRDGRGQSVEVGDLHLDPTQRRVAVGGVQVELTPTEFCVLEYLMRLRGRVVSKKELLESCWDWGFRGEPNIVEVYIGMLRKKIDAPFGRAQIQTVRGAGYRLVGIDGDRR
jgi:DNA-binding response OmpR family regulator